MERNEVIGLFRCIGSAVAENLPEILEPFSKYGSSIGAIIKAVNSGAEDYKKLKKKAVEEIKQKVAETPNPNFMDCVIFTCKEGGLTQKQQDMLVEILQRNFDSENENALAVIDEFISYYMGGNVEINSEDDCDIGTDYLYFNFYCDGVEIDEFPCDAEDMKILKGTLNLLLGEEVFDDFLISGHDKSWNE